MWEGFLKTYVKVFIILETLLLAVFLVLDISLFYIFFDSILPPLFILIGLFGSSNRVRASFYLFLDTLLASFFIRNRISHYRTYRGWSRYRCSFRSSYIRCGKKPIFKRTTFFLCNFRICFFRSYWIIRFDDGFFATLCGITMIAYRVFSLCA